MHGDHFTHDRSLFVWLSLVQLVDIDLSALLRFSTGYRPACVRKLRHGRSIHYAAAPAAAEAADDDDDDGDDDDDATTKTML